MGNTKSLQSNDLKSKYNTNCKQQTGYSQDTLHQILLEYWFRTLLNKLCLQDIANIINHYAKWDLLDSENQLKIEYIEVRSVSTHNNIVYYDIFVKTIGSNNEWQFAKTYSQFSDLYTKIYSLPLTIKIPFFPKHSFMDFMNQKNDIFIENRRALLNNFIKKVVKLSLNLPKNISCQCVIDFFSDNIVSYQDINNVNKIEFPKEQKVHKIVIDKTRKMSDHVLYQVYVSDSYNNWIMLKRFDQFAKMDCALRGYLQKNNTEILRKLPVSPPKKMKMFFDHMEDDFIEQRRVLMENYCQKLLRFPVVVAYPPFCVFFGVILD
eukprot:90969_1